MPVSKTIKINIWPTYPFSLSGGWRRPVVDRGGGGGTEHEPPYPGSPPTTAAAAVGPEYSSNTFAGGPEVLEQHVNEAGCREVG